VHQKEVPALTTVSTVFFTGKVGNKKKVTKINKINKTAPILILFLLYGSGFVDFH